MRSRKNFLWGRDGGYQVWGAGPKAVGRVIWDKSAYLASRHAIGRHRLRPVPPIGEDLDLMSAWDTG